MEMELESQSKTMEGEEPHCISGKTNHLVTLKFENVVYKINIREKKSYLSRYCGILRNDSRKASNEKMILKGITGVVLPGEILAMLGPSGSGKTTLLTALGGRLGGNLSGNITYNGKPFSNIIKRNMGFVTQDDVLYPHLTVTETLVYTGLLRLPNSLSREEKEKHAKAIIDELGLTRCKDNIIGGPFVRGVSGGERKRVSIGQEMLINPSLLFLDEPTSGLDSTTAQRIVSMLAELAKGGRTVVMTIHQPSSHLFYMFHKVVLLSSGHTLYFGKGSDAMDYFSGIGYAPSVAMNPADFLLDLANGFFFDETEESQLAIKEALVSFYERSLKDTLIEEIGQIDNQSSESMNDKKIYQWNTSWWQQFSVLLSRGAREYRHEAFSSLTVGQVLAVAVLVGLLWWQSYTSHIQDQIGLLFFYSSFWGSFPLFRALFTFPQERAMLIKERSSGMYRLSSYFMARMATDMPMELVLPTIFFTITYWMVGLRPNIRNYFYTLSVLLFGVVVSHGIGLAIGALVMDMKSASTIASVVMLTFMLVGGYFVQHVPAIISWIKYFSFTHYIYKLLLGSQFSPGDTYECGSHSSCLISDLPIIKNVGLDNKEIAVMALLIMVVVYRLIAYAGLTRVGVK